MLKKNSPALINSWTSFDWSNSVYNLIVTTAIFLIYFIDQLTRSMRNSMVFMAVFFIKGFIFIQLAYLKKIVK